MLRRYFPALDTEGSTPAPLTLDITVIETDPGVWGGFYYSLSRPLLANITVNLLIAFNYITCGARQQGSVSMLSDFLITAGEQDGIILADSIDGTVNTDKFTVRTCRINGVILANGDTLTVGGQTVTVRLQQCS